MQLSVKNITKIRPAGQVLKRPVLGKESVVNNKNFFLPIAFPKRLCYNENEQINEKKAAVMMTELETMQRAKMYMDKLAQGIDPISGRELPEDSALNQVRLARCFFYVSDILGQVIANGGVIGGKPKLAPFQISPEQLSRVAVSQEPVRVTQLVDRISEAVHDPGMKKPSTTAITNWLMDKGFLEKIPTPDGKSKRVPTENGLRLGMFTQLRQGQYGEYQAVYYNADAQRFVLDHLMDMLA